MTYDFWSIYFDVIWLTCQYHLFQCTHWGLYTVREYRYTYVRCLFTTIPALNFVARGVNVLNPLFTFYEYLRATL